MSDDLRQRFDESLEGVPVPPPCVTTAKLRGTQRVRRRWAAVVVSVLILVATAGWVVADLGDDNRPVAPAGDGSTPARDVDEIALGVIDHLGRECPGYDFYYRSQIAGFEYRLVQCGLQTEARQRVLDTIPTATAWPNPTPSPVKLAYDLVEGPRLNLYAFGHPAARDAWLSSHPAPWGGRFGTQDWIIDVMDRYSFGGIGEALSGSGARILDRPSRSWRMGHHVVNALPLEYEPRFSLGRATRRLELDAEILGAQLGAYTSRFVTDPVPAWIVTVRNCVEQYGGSDASENCRGDQTHFVVDTRSGQLVTTFST